MSLIQQALERAGSVPATPVVTLEPQKLPQAKPAAKKVITPVSVPRGAELRKRLHADEEAQLSRVEDFIREKKRAKTDPTVQAVLIAIMVGVLIGGWLAISKVLFEFHPDVSVSPPSLLLPTDKSAWNMRKNPISSKGMVLSGITVTGKQRMALINNQIVSAGMTLKNGKVTVKNITERSVFLEENGREIVLSL